MDIERSPIINDVIVLRSNSDDAHLRMFTEKVVTDARSFPRPVERNDHKTWQGPVYGLNDFRFVGDLTDNFNVGLVGEGCENSLPHETGTVCHENPDGFFHRTLPAAQVSRSRTISVRIKSKLSAGTTLEMGKIPMKLSLIPNFTQSETAYNFRPQTDN